MTSVIHSSDSPPNIIRKNSKSLSCGILCWRPSFLYSLRDIRAFIAAACYISCIQSAFSGYSSSQITTIEKRFAIGSILIGVINSFFEVGYISCVMIVSYAGSKGRVPLWIASGLFAMSLGAFLYTLPHFLFPKSKIYSLSNIDHVCNSNTSANVSLSFENSSDRVLPEYYFMMFFVCAQFLIGAGSSPILTLAPPFIDDHVSPSKAPAMIASIYAAAALGPVFGYGLGACLLQYPADILSNNANAEGLTPDHVDWIGAWWAGYIILGTGILFGSFIVVLFPRKLKSNYRLSRTLSASAEAIVPMQNGTIDMEAKVDDRTHTDGKHYVGDLLSLNADNSAFVDIHINGKYRSSLPSRSPMGPTGTFRRFSSSVHDRRTRTISGGSILVRAAIAAATASHADDSSLSEDSNDYEEFLDDGSSFVFNSDSDGYEAKLTLKTKRTSSIQSGDPHKSKHTPNMALDLHKSRRHSRILSDGPNFLRSSIHRFSFNKTGTEPQLDAPNKDKQYSSSPKENPPLCTFNLIISPVNTTILPVPNVPKDASLETQPPFQRMNDQQTGSMASGKAEKDLSRVDADIFQTDVAEAPLPVISADTVSDSASGFPKGMRRRKIVRGRSFGFIEKWSKDIPRCICCLLHNKIYLVTCLCICSEMFIIIGFAGFLPKYLEIEYQISKSRASVIAGGLIIPAGALGILVGGLILNKFRLRRRSAIIFVLSINVLIIACLCMFFFLGCENPAIAGFTVDYPSRQTSGAQNSFQTPRSGSAIFDLRDNQTCLASCNCVSTSWLPACHAESGVTFFSPCYAGCSHRSSSFSNGQNIYSNCSCLSSFVLPAPASSGSEPPSSSYLRPDDVKVGVCPLPCNTLVPFICVLTWALFLTGVIQNPLLMVTMRSVGRPERSLALGLQFVILRLLANLPSPITYGRAIDGACLFWREEFGRRGDCAFTDARSLTLFITGLSIAIKGGSILIYVLLIYLIPAGDSSVDESRNIPSCMDHAVLPIEQT